MTNARTGSPMVRLAGVALLLALVACGDDGTVTAPPTPTPPTPVPPTPIPATLVLQGQQGLQAPKSLRGTNEIVWDFTTPVDGAIDVTVTYLHGNSKILVWVTDRQCTKWQFERDECFYLTKSLEGSSPRKLTATGVKAGEYSLVVANDGPNDEQIGYQVYLTPSTRGLSLGR